MTHDAFQDLTPFELLVWFWEDHFERNPIEAKKVGVDEEVQFVTDDPLINKWEDEIARGLVPDLMEGLTNEQRQRERNSLEKLKNRKTQIKKAEKAGDGFSDDYTDVPFDAAGLPVIGRGR